MKSIPNNRPRPKESPQPGCPFNAYGASSEEIINFLKCHIKEPLKNDDLLDRIVTPKLGKALNEFLAVDNTEETFLVLHAISTASMARERGALCRSLRALLRMQPGGENESSYVAYPRFDRTEFEYLLGREPIMEGPPSEYKAGCFLDDLSEAQKSNKGKPVETRTIMFHLTWDQDKRLFDERALRAFYSLFNGNTVHSVNRQSEATLAGKTRFLICVESRYGAERIHRHPYLTFPKDGWCNNYPEARKTIEMSIKGDYPSVKGKGLFPSLPTTYVMFIDEKKPNDTIGGETHFSLIEREQITLKTMASLYGIIEKLQEEKKVLEAEALRASSAHTFNVKVIKTRDEEIEKLKRSVEERDKSYAVLDKICRERIDELAVTGHQLREKSKLVAEKDLLISDLNKRLSERKVTTTAPFAENHVDGRGNVSLCEDTTIVVRQEEERRPERKKKSKGEKPMHMEKLNDDDDMKEEEEEEEQTTKKKKRKNLTETSYNKEEKEPSPKKAKLTEEKNDDDDDDREEKIGLSTIRESVMPRIMALVEENPRYTLENCTIHLESLYEVYRLSSAGEFERTPGHTHGNSTSSKRKVFLYMRDFLKERSSSSLSL